MFEIMICPLKRLYQLACDGDMSEVAVLAVSSYDVSQEKLKVFSKKLCLNFNDITNATDASAFTNNIAQQIAEYIKQLPEYLDTLFVCCDSGESRSSAMAAAILRYKGFDDMKIWKNPKYHPNPLVYKLLCKAFNIDVTDAEVDGKIKINEQAFSDAING